MFRNAKIGTRLLCGFGLIALFISAIASFAIANLEQSSLRTGLLIALVTAVIITTVIAWFLTRSIVAPLRDVLRVTEAVAIGNLNVEVDLDSRDEIGQVFSGMQQMVKKLRGVIADVKIVADRVACGSNDLARASEDMSSGASKLSDQIRSIVTAMGEISRAVSDVAANAASSASASEEVLQAAVGGRRAVDATAQDMQTIEDAIQSAAITIDELSGNSVQIGQIVGVINEIAGQTNLLALNAAIEAARAGEQGRGFAVVADEVRGLAERTTQSTKIVEEKVRGIQQAATESVTAIHSGGKEVSNGVFLASEARKSLDVIVTTSGRAEELVHRIASATEQQSAAVGEVTDNLGKISEITRQSEDTSQQIQSSAGDLAKLAADLKRLISFFKGTSAEAEALVGRAIAHIKKYGRKKAFADFSDKNGEFVNRDLFVFVYDMQGTCLAHGRNTEKIGENQTNFQDPDGTYVVRERIEIAKTRAKAWQDIKSINPTTKKVENKACYLEVYDDILICSGAYK